MLACFDCSGALGVYWLRCSGISHLFDVWGFHVLHVVLHRMIYHDLYRENGNVTQYNIVSSGCAGWICDPVTCGLPEQLIPQILYLSGLMCMQTSSLQACPLYDVTFSLPSISLYRVP